MCAQCKKTREFGDLEFMRSPEFRARLEVVATRATAVAALRVCDDPLEWDWRGYLALRRGSAIIDG